jgi:sulfite reductase alpha subunit-like flavoprotein
VDRRPDADYVQRGEDDETLRTAVDVASRRALEDAEHYNRSSDTGLRGYLTEERGFLPTRAPSTALPPSHTPWDELAEELPALFRSVSFREVARQLPVLDARPPALPDADVRRAATVLGILAHSWFRVETAEPGPLPEAIARPWAEVCERLGRSSPFLEFEDITTANWRLRDPDLPDLMRVENLDLLVPSVGNDAERFFMMTLVELAARATPIVGAVVRAQECMQREDLAGLEAELVLLVHTVRGLIDGLTKADPNPNSATYVDPVVWGVTVAPFAVSINPAAPSPGGTAAPLFQVLDAFLGRRAYGSLLGKEVRRLHDVAPPLQRAFTDAVSEMPLGAFLARVGTPTLRGLSRALMEVYAGEQGLLQAHRIKAYGYLEVAFKVGRPVTLSGFAGVFRERPWKRVDDALDTSMRERSVDGIGTWVARAALSERETTAPRATDRVRRIALDVREQGVIYGPGDRVAVLPDNGAELAAKVVDALHATADTEITLTSGWQAALERRGINATPRLRLFDFLRWAKLRPLIRPVAKTLYSLSRAPELGGVIEGRYEDQLELWDALVMITAAGYDVRRLTDADPWQPESLAAIVPPEHERLYSISSAPTSSTACQDDLVLTVGDVSYVGTLDSGAEPVVRDGVGSHWLNHHMVEQSDAVALRVVRPSRFQLPEDASRPVVMFAGGTGISPFRGFLQARAGTGASPRAPNVLFYAARRADDLLYRDELDAWVRRGDLELHVALSRDDVQIVASHDRGVVEVPGGPRWVQDLIDEQAARLLALTNDAALGVVYICGQASFAHAVMDGLRRIAAAPIHPHDDGGHQFVRHLVGEQRLLMDVFTTTAPVRAPGPLGAQSVAASDLITRNDDDAGYWMAIDGAVYDVTEFRHLHPGGPQILIESAGTDATEEFRAVLHDRNGEIGAMLSMYKVGLLRRLRLGSKWGIAATADGFADVSVADLYRAWVRYTYLVVEMQNALRNDWMYRPLPLTRDEHEELTTQKLMLLANTHDRFVVQYVDGTLGDDLVALWRLTTGLCDPRLPLNELPRMIADVRSSSEAAAAEAIADEFRRLYLTSRLPAPAGEDRFWSVAAELWEHVRRVQERYLAELKGTLRRGLELFERDEHEVVERAGADLVDLLRSVPAIVSREYVELADAWNGADVTRWRS